MAFLQSRCLTAIYHFCTNLYSELFLLSFFFFFQFPHPHQRLRVVFVQQTVSKRFVSSVTALHCTARATIVLVSQSLYVAEDPEFRSCVKIEVAILGSPSLKVHTVSAGRKTTLEKRAQEQCERRGGRPELPVPNKVIVHTVSVDVKQH